MSNMPAIDKRKVSLQLPIKVIHALDKMANKVNFSRNEMASAILANGTSKVKLDDDDIKAINEEIRRNREARGN